MIKPDKLFNHVLAIFPYAFARKSSEQMEYVFSIEAMVRGYHEYKDIWEAPVGGILQWQREVGNVHDTCAVAVMKEGTIVGHCPQKISAPCFISIQRGGRITCQVTGGRRYLSDLPQGGLQVLCVLKFQSKNKQDTEKVEKLIRRRQSVMSHLFLSV